VATSRAEFELVKEQRVMVTGKGVEDIEVGLEID
jgi:hypothetical protein